MLSMTPNVAAFDRWVRGGFRDMNTELENLYFALEDRAAVAGVGESIKRNLLEEGRNLLIPLLREGNIDEGFDRGFDLLGNVGLYMAACERHEITLHTREANSPLYEASALAMNWAPRWAWRRALPPVISPRTTAPWMAATRVSPRSRTNSSSPITTPAASWVTSAPRMHCCAPGPWACRTR